MLLCLRVPWLTWIIPLLTLVGALAGTYEMYKMVQHKGGSPSLPIAIAGTCAFMIAGLFAPSVFLVSSVAAVLLLTMCAFAAQMSRAGVEDSLRSVPFNVFAPVYVGLPLAIGLQVLWHDRIHFLFVLLLVWTLDTCAYYIGRRYGTTKLAPSFSPGKTREGALGGIAGCFVISIVFKLLVPNAAFDLTWREVLTVSLLISIIGQIGDLAESMFKRDAGVKDSGVPLTGHGGVLDRLDSLLFAFPVFYLFLIVTHRLALFEIAAVSLR